MKDYYVVVDKYSNILYYNEYPDSNGEEVMTLSHASYTKDILNDCGDLIVCKLVQIEENT